MNQQRDSQNNPVCDWCGNGVRVDEESMVDGRRFEVHQSCFDNNHPEPFVSDFRDSDFDDDSGSPRDDGFQSCPCGDPDC